MVDLRTPDRVLAELASARRQFKKEAGTRGAVVRQRLLLFAPLLYAAARHLTLGTPWRVT
jgi:hypothetical protein